MGYGATLKRSARAEANVASARTWRVLRRRTSWPAAPAVSRSRRLVPSGRSAVRQPASLARGHVENPCHRPAASPALPKREEASDANQGQKRRSCVQDEDRGHGEVPFRDVHRISPPPKRKFEESAQLHKNSARARARARGLGARGLAGRRLTAGAWRGWGGLTTDCLHGNLQIAPIGGVPIDLRRRRAVSGSTPPRCWHGRSARPGSCREPSRAGRPRSRSAAPRGCGGRAQRSSA